MKNKNNSFLDVDNLILASKKFGTEGPFDHVVVDNFFSQSVANELENEFPNYVHHRNFSTSNELSIGLAGSINRPPTS